MPEPKINYIGIFLTDASHQKLLEEFSPIHPEIYGDHITLFYNPNLEMVDRYRGWIGYKIPILTGQEFCDRKGQAVIAYIGADITRESYPSSHITISCATGVPPRYSNDLVNGNIHGFRNPIRLVGVVDTFPRGLLPKATDLKEVKIE